MKYFGTDGIRMAADKFTPEFLGYIARGLVDYAGSEIRVFIAGDTRESSEWMIRSFENAFEALGVEYSSAGILPTPAINYCFYQMGFDFAIDLTASHNPYTDNGVKIFERGVKTGQKLRPAACEVIEKAILAAEPLPEVSPTLREDLHSEALELYKKHLEDYLGEVDFSGLHIGMDCANGATSVIGSDIFTSLGAEVELINCCKNYNKNINHACGSTHLEALKTLVLEKKLDFGFAFDGDGDRVLMIDDAGSVVDGDEALVILADFLKLDKIAVSVMTNQGFLNWADENHLTIEITPVGDSNVAAAMLEKNISLGGEQSGHTILPGETTGDGMLTALLLTKAVVETGQSLRSLASKMQKSPQVILNFPATPEQKLGLKEKPAAKAILLKYHQQLEPVRGRLLVRPSGTENLIRITIWGDDEQIITELANHLKTDLEEIL